MATRRHRIVIKPNIKPVGAKTSSSIPPKTKFIPPNSASESSSPAVQPQQIFLSSEETHQSLNDEEIRNGETISDADFSKQTPKASLDVVERSSTEDVTPMVIGNEQMTPPVSKEAKSEVQTQGDLAHTKEKTHKDVEEGSFNKVSVKCSSNQVATPSKAEIPAGHQRKHQKPSALDVENQVLKLKNFTESAELVKGEDMDEDGVTPSETDGSCMSEAMSMDPGDERREEAGDKAQKKRRSHKSKKLRPEPLPSREKSPDRQTMKMSDLLLWNPQQNFLPKKNKKRTPLKSENRPPSPASIGTIESDKESTNQSASLPAPQVMIGPDGSVVLNTESLLIQTQKEDEIPKEVLEDDDDDRYLNTNTYRKYKKTKLWTEGETEKFFMGLSMCGTDFSLLTNLLPNRSRRELKNKFHREERRNRDLIDLALANRKQYDLTPFEKMAAEEGKKKNKTKLMKQVKKKALNEKKVNKTSGKKKGRKRKIKESEDEEVDWRPERDEEDEENENKVDGHEKSAVIIVSKNKSKVPKVKNEKDNQNTKRANQNISDIIPEDTSTPFLPGYTTPRVPNVQETVAAEVPLYEEYADLDNPQMRSKPTKTYSKGNSENRTQHPQTASTMSTVTSSNTNNGAIQAIPGSTQVQIEIEGVQNPVQGVLIPSHMVPQIAPQLGIQGNTAGIQVLLVQEEMESGSLVHVYVIPEGDTAQASGNNVTGGASGSSNHPVFTSPIPSPHPTAPIQSPHTISPFPVPCSPHPLASVCSTHPNSAFQNPPPVIDVQPGQSAQIPPHQVPISAPRQNLYPQSKSTSDNQEFSYTLQEQHLNISQPEVNLNSSLDSLSIRVNNDSTSTKDEQDKLHSHISSTADSTNSLPQSANLNDRTSTVLLEVPNLLSNSSETAFSNTQRHSSETAAISFEERTVNGSVIEVHVPCNSSSVDQIIKNEFDDEDDCVIISDGPRGQMDKTALSGV